MLDKWHKKEKPVFTGITRGMGGFGFGGAGGGAADGATPGPLGASGGNIADGLKPGNGYVYHTFGTPGTFTCTNQNEIEVLVVGGGGATGAFCTGGAGGGGVVHATSYLVTAGDHTITIGDGGVTTSPGPDTSAGKGGDSYFGSPGPARLTGYGGGRGAKWPTATFPYEDPNPDNNSTTGGSGAGGVRNGPWPGNGAPSTFYNGKAATQVNPLNQDAPGTVTNYGNPGGNGGGASPNSLVGGGGGGAGGAGDDFPGSDGGVGQRFPGFAYPDCFSPPYLPNLTPASPTNDHYAGGGGGARHLAGQGSSDGTPTSGGYGGGGDGGNGQPVRETDGVDYLGGGGGDGGGYESTGSNGGKGIVIIRYPTANE